MLLNLDQAKTEMSIKENTVDTELNNIIVIHSDNLPSSSHNGNSDFYTIYLYYLLHVIAENKEGIEIIQQRPSKVKPNISIKRKRMETLDEEKSLRKQKLIDSIQQQKEFHKSRMEAIELEKEYWRKKIDLL